MDILNQIALGSTFGVFATTVVIFVLLVLGGTVAFWIWMLVDCARRPFEDPGGNLRLVWVLVIVLAGWIGALIYLFAVKIPQDRKIKIQ
jgi:hypothetical protein